MKRICYCYIHEPAPERQAPQNEPFRKTDQAYIAALRRALATSYPDWKIEINHKGEVLEDILDQYDFFVCAPGIASRWFPSKQFQKKVFYVTGFEYASQNVRRFMKVFSAVAQK